MDLGFVVRRLPRKMRKVRNRFWQLVSDRAMAAYWYTNEYNFGDLLTPLLLRHFGMRPLFCYYPSHADVVAVGSVLQLLPDSYPGIIAGSGLIAEQDDLRFPHATIVALRGELTKRCLGVSAPVPLGDPGLLVPDIIRIARRSQRYVLGVVPHYVDKHSSVVGSLAKRYPNEVVVIDVQRSPTRVVRDIAQCGHVLSSSLHGVVIADALHVPSCWTILSDSVLGGGFKFHDYYSALGIRREPVTVGDGTRLATILDAMQTAPPQLADVQAGLRAAFAALPQYYGALQARRRTQAAAESI